jgi:uncharacterized protein (TIGR03435 family)
MLGPMMQRLLEERFRLNVHHEKKEMPVYALTAAKSGAKLQKFIEGSCMPMEAVSGPKSIVRSLESAVRPSRPSQS